MLPEGQNVETTTPQKSKTTPHEKQLEESSKRRSPRLDKACWQPWADKNPSDDEDTEPDQMLPEVQSVEMTSPQKLKKTPQKEQLGWKHEQILDNNSSKRRSPRLNKTCCQPRTDKNSLDEDTEADECYIFKDDSPLTKLSKLRTSTPESTPEGSKKQLFYDQGAGSLPTMHISRLPDLVLIKIFLFLHTFNLIRCKQVCNRWNKLIESHMDIFLAEISMFDVSKQEGVPHLTDFQLRRLFQLSKTITKLNFFRCYSINGQCWVYNPSKFKFLKSLNLAYTVTTSENLIVLLESCSMLEVLELSDCPNLTDDILPSIGKCSNLRSLSLPSNISDNYLGDPLSKLNKLKQLDLECIFTSGNTFVEVLESVCKDLETLIVPYSSLSEYSLYKCLKMFPSLKFMCICESGINTDFSSKLHIEFPGTVICNEIQN